MLGLLGLVAATLGLALLILPFWSFLRVYRLTGEVARLRARIDQLERDAARSAAAGRQPAVSAERSPIVPDPAAPSGQPAAPFEQPPAPFVPPAEPAWSAAPVNPAPATLSDDLESRVGGRWLLYVGVVILLVGVSFFLKYAFDNQWISPAARVLLGGVAGLALVAIGWAQLKLGSRVEARDSFRNALGFLRELGDRKSLAEALHGLGETSAGQPDVARTHLLEALTIYEDYDHPLTPEVRARLHELA